jgi:hypothetical protein
MTLLVEDHIHTSKLLSLTWMPMTFSFGIDKHPTGACALNEVRVSLWCVIFSAEHRNHGVKLRIQRYPPSGFPVQSDTPFRGHFFGVRSA